MKDTTILEQKELDVMACGGWGTISSHSVTGAAALADYVDAKHGLLCHSLDAAYEALIRHFGAALANTAYGDYIVTAEVSEPLNSLVAVCVGAAPLFVPNCCSCGMAKPKAIEEALTSGKTVRCVTVDLLPEKIDDYKLDKLAEICKVNNVPLILNAGGYFSMKWQGKALVDFADAVIYSLEEGSEIYTGKGGFIATKDTDVYAGAFAYHNCGRGFGEGCSLNVDEIVGGDLRVTEWTSVAAEAILETKQFSEAAPRKLVKMAGQPVFESAYAKKMTGN
ncbi:MAG: DegT/DnrJ/EryC1/StrS family aminotransferase [Clostridia bacterium]|nr:DegT/DnrJ/EryC1/StrS family aminotransferase [Clostridia bacterium]